MSAIHPLLRDERTYFHLAFGACPARSPSPRPVDRMDVAGRGIKLRDDMGDAMGRPRSIVPDDRPMPWESDAVANQVQQILDDVEAPPIDTETRRTLARWLWRRDKFEGDGRGHITYLLRVIVESGNGNVLNDMVLHAVSSCLHPVWVERGLAFFDAMDQVHIGKLLETMRELQVFEERELSTYLARHSESVAEDSRRADQARQAREEAPSPAMAATGGYHR